MRGTSHAGTIVHDGVRCNAFGMPYNSSQTTDLIRDPSGPLSPLETFRGG
jgi:hypothetical protein